MSYFKKHFSFKEPKDTNLIAKAITAVFPQFILNVQDDGTHKGFTVSLHHPITSEEEAKIEDILQKLNKTAADWRAEYAQAKEKDLSNKICENRLAVIARTLGLEESN